MRAVVIMNAQNDFVIHYPEGKAIAEHIADKVRELADGRSVLFTVQDTHHDFARVKQWPWPLIGHYGHEIAPEVLAAIYDTRLKYKDINNLFKVEPCAYELISLIKKQGYDEIILMGFRKEDMLETAKIIKEDFPNVKIALDAVSYDVRRAIIGTSYEGESV